LACQNPQFYSKAIAETRFLASDKETGFLNKDFHLDAKAIAETRFLASDKETGFLNKDFHLDAKAIAETRFLTPASH
jgi:hypothetical protein